MAEQWEGTGQWDAGQWLVRWVESVDIGSGFDAGSPSPTFAPGTGPYDGQPVAADSGLGAGQAEASSSAQPPAARTFGEEYPHFPNGHRRLGLSPQALVECSWLWLWHCSWRWPYACAWHWPWRCAFGSTRTAIVAARSNPPGTPSQINEPCSMCRSGHCGLCLLRADFPHTHRCSSCYQRWKRGEA